MQYYINRYFYYMKLQPHIVMRGDIMAESIGKKAEKKIKEWLDRPEDGYCFDRIPDPIGGYFGQRNICDFQCFKSPDMWFIESKATEQDRFDFSMLSEIQYYGLLQKSKIAHVHGIVIVLFVIYQRAFILDIRDIDELNKKGKKSLNIKKIDKWEIPYREIETIPSRKQMLDYTGEL